MQFAAALFYALGIGIDIIDPDESDPSGLHAAVKHRLSQLHEPGGVKATGRE